MPKLQKIKRANGSSVFSVNIPLEMIEELKWEKGNILDLEIQKVGDTPKLVIIKQEGEVINNG